jgi:adenylate kinase
MRFVMLGPQGVGKGTQAERLAAATGTHHISTGDVVRAEIHACTELGRAMAGYHTRGELVPTDLMVAMVRGQTRGLSGWILDGFPRTVDQARALDASLQEIGASLNRAILLDAPESLLIERLAGRRQSEATGHVYHLVYDPPGNDDPGPFVQREDDTTEAIRRRLEIYHTQTEPLRGYYAERGLLAVVDARGSIEATAAAVIAALREDASGPPAAGHTPPGLPLQFGGGPLLDVEETLPAPCAVGAP